MANGIGSKDVGTVLKQVVNISNELARGRHAVWFWHCIQWQQIAYRGRSVMSAISLFIALLLLLSFTVFIPWNSVFVLCKSTRVDF